MMAHSPPTPFEPRDSIRFLTINDIYDAEGTINISGFSYLTTYLKKYRTNRSVFTVNGDFLGGSSLSVAVSGEHVIKIFNEMKVDIVGLGNHEFDFGETVLKQRIAESNFPWLGINVRMNNEIFPGVLPYVIKTYDLTDGPIKIGIFGTCTPLTPTLSHPSEDVIFEDPIEWSTKTIAELKSLGCNILVALTHQSLYFDIELARACPELNLILGGHDHHAVTCMEGDCLIVKTGQNAQYLGVIDLYIKKSMISHRWELVPTLHDVEPDRAVFDILDHYQTIANTLMAKSAGFEDPSESLFKVVDCELYTLTSITRKKESAFGTLIADAIAWYFSHRPNVVGIINGGFIRRDRSYPIGYIMKISDFLHELPFPMAVELVKLKGSTLKLILEQQLKMVPYSSGSYPHLSKDLKAVFDSDAPSLDRIKSLYYKEQLLTDDMELELGCSAFMATGGDQITGFKQGTVITDTGKERILLSHVVIDYCRYLRDQTGESVFNFSATLPLRLVDEHEN